MTDLSLELTYISWQELLLRVGLAMVVGLVLGLERDSKNKPIDFRAYMIVAVIFFIVIPNLIWNLVFYQALK